MSFDCKVVDHLRFLRFEFEVMAYFPNALILILRFLVILACKNKTFDIIRGNLISRIISL